MKYLIFWNRREIHLCVIVGMGLAVLSRCSGIWVSSVGGEGCEQGKDEQRSS